ncbi:hypothetical protein BFP77_08405 [Maribacter sp. 4U21]|uniref:hypothetical protein n=1 Tax=Maribacter sp. 4U21 TaxID=1889779 RepID=UPI000C157269|nr:hypothetical protein [Maribacter sp. 4U21]PIB28929.1 hypothetical protein BFP77_08405 [Maribacter sp. 4U21]
MPLNDFYEKLTKDKRVLFVRWVLIVFATGISTMAIGWYKSRQYQAQLEVFKVNEIAREKEIVTMKFEIQDLRENQIRFDQLEDQYANPRILKDLRGNALSINQAYYVDFMQPFGFQKSDYKNDVEFYGVEFSSKIRELEQTAIKLGRPITVDFMTKLPFGDLPDINRKVTVNPLRDRYGQIFMLEIAIFKEYK